MLSLRTLARSAPRTASRLATTPIRSSPFTCMRIISSRSTAPLRRIAAFSTTSTFRDEHSQQLAAKLDSEISIEREEADAQAESDQNIESFKSENPFWTIEDSPGEQEVFLKRKYEDEDITVHFSIADFQGEQEYNEMDEAMADEEDMDVQSHGANTKGAINQGQTRGGNFKVAPEDSIAPADREELADDESADSTPQYPVTVTVLIQRPNKGALKFYLSATEGDFIIGQVIQLPQNIKGDYKELIRNTHDHLYAGPPFAQLDEEVQGILESFLTARGISEYLAQVVPDYIDVKEQKEYLGWLGRVKEFLE